MRKSALKYLFLSISLLLCCSNFAHAANFLTVKYAAKGGDSLKSIVIYFFKEGTNPVDANESLKVTMKQNPSIKQWNPLAKDTTFKLYLDPKITDLKKYREYFIKNKQSDTHHIVLSTMPSIGFYSQSNKNGYVVKYNQISLVSMGATYLYTPFVSPYHMSASLYYSMISSTSNQISSGTTKEVDIPAEYGLNVYGIYAKRNSQFQYYAGLDYENFSSFNIQNIITNDSVSIDSNTVYYLTAGLNYKPRAIEKLSVKLAVSKSIISKAEPGLAASTPAELSGIKYILFLNYSFNEKWSANAMFKGHNFSGDNDLSVNRVGIGVSYQLF